MKLHAYLVRIFFHSRGAMMWNNTHLGVTYRM